MQYVVILFYKYIEIQDPEKLVEQQREIGERLHIKGRIIIAKEGINGTAEGTSQAIEEYCSLLHNDPRFSDLWFKKSEGDGTSFKKLQVRVRNDIISDKISHWEVNPAKTTGKYLTAEQLHQWFIMGKKFYIVDMRNNYEHASGHFEGSILPGMETFRDLPKFIPELKKLSNAPIVTVCTGGVRCEKASGFLIKNGIQNVYQLHGGIVTYMEKYPNQQFKGKLYVFDQRILMGMNIEDPAHQVIGKCAHCGSPSETYINCRNDNCHRHLIMCSNCIGQDGTVICPQGCRKMK